MNEKITFPRLAAMLADKSGRSKRFSEDFLREFFALISEKLEDGEGVKIKGLGTFKLSRVEPRKSVDVTTGQPMEISGHSKVVFTPSKELAEAINSPFEAFSPIEIEDGIDLSLVLPQDDIDIQDTLTVQDPTIAISDTQDSLEEAKVENEPENYPASSLEESATTETTEEDTSIQEKEDAAVAEETAFTPEDTIEELDSDRREDATHRKSRTKIIMISFCATIVALIAILAVWYVFFTSDFNRIFNREAYAESTNQKNGHSSDKLNTEELATISTLSDSIDTTSDAESEEVPTAPSDALVYDTIGATRYLTTMARAHYGNFNFWPYIYEENKNILGHPDRIKPGTPVVIPKLSKYGADPSNKEDVEKAKKLGVEIYARYGKKI